MRVWLIAVLGLVLMNSCAAAQDATGGQRPRDDDSGAPANVWGGNAVVMTVGDEGATLEFECAKGTITERLRLNSGAKFRAKGTYDAEHAGPTLRDEDSRAVDAVYSGTVENHRMRLQVLLSGQKRPTHTYELVRGHYGNLTRCK
jgi:hypothetical protein